MSLIVVHERLAHDNTTDDFLKRYKMARGDSNDETDRLLLNLVERIEQMALIIDIIKSDIKELKANAIQTKPQNVEEKRKKMK